MKKQTKTKVLEKKKEEPNEFLQEVSAGCLDANASPVDTATLTVVKRGGAIVPFNRERIVKAMEAAFRDTKRIDGKEALPDALLHTIERLTQNVETSAAEAGTKGVALSVEGIQDLVELSLMKHGYHDVARDYIIYREKHQEEREKDPSHIRLYRHDGASKVRFNAMKIAATFEKLLRHTNNLSNDVMTPQETIEIINILTQKVVEKVIESQQESASLSLSNVKDFIEEILMKDGFFAEAKHYIITRKEHEDLKHKAMPEAKREEKADKSAKEYTVTLENGKVKKITEADIRRRIQYAITGYEKETSYEELVRATLMNFYEGIKETEVDTALIMAARAKIESEPCFAYITAKLLLDKVYRETMEVSGFDPDFEEKHKEYFAKYIKKGIHYERLSPKLLDFDLVKLSEAMDTSRDFLIQYLGLQTLYDRYFIHHEQRRLETPQIFWMRVAMGLAIEEENKTEKAIEFYNLLSQQLYSPGTPTLFNSGTMHSQLSSCYLSTINDDLEHIFKVISDDAQLSKWAGGLGNDWTSVRATGSLIKGTNGHSQGVIPFLKVANDTAVAVNQGGKRKGALCSYLETWHLDIEDFLELRKNTGDERRRTHDMNTANWIPDLFMKRVRDNMQWTLFSPSDTPDLHDLYGAAFERRYEEYEKMVKDGKLKLYKSVSAVELWRKMISMLFETGHPWITFKDPSNVRSPQSHVGVVHSSNLCTEILLNTSKEEVAVCNLGSVNLLKHIKENGELDEEKLSKTVTTAMRMLDNVIDINFYPIAEAKNANHKHRAVGLGLMGFQDVLYKRGFAYSSREAVDTADEIMEMISYYAINASSDLAKERGTYSSYEGSKWSQGLLPIDTIDVLEKERDEKVEMDRSRRMDWDTLREKVKKQGMRNCNTMAIAPTATIANIAGVIACIEPTYKNLYVKSNLSGEFTVPNIYLIEELKKRGLWDDEMLDDLKYYDGELSEIERVPDDIKKLFLTAFDIDPEWLIECGSRRQKWIDMGQSLNLYLSEPSGKKLSEMYFSAWKKGLKTTYYLRTLGATQIEKSTTDINKRGLQPRWMKNASASSRVQVTREAPKACSMEEGCESCQ